MSSSTKISRRLILKDKNPTAVKVAQVCDLAYKLGISFHFHSNGVVVTDADRDQELPPIHLEDIEEGHHYTGFPFETEYKLVYENPAYIAQQKREWEEEERRREEYRKADEERRQRELKAEEERKAYEKEMSERRQLAYLKEKYENEPRR